MKTLAKLLPSVLAGALLVGHLYAQPQAPSPAAEEVDAPKPVLSPEEMTLHAQEQKDELRVAIQGIQALRTRARKEQDVIKLTCVNDKFVKLKAQANIFDQAHRDLLAVIDTDERVEAFERLTKIASEIRAIREEATVCIGEQQLGESESGYTAPTIVDDPTLGLPFDIQVEAPAYASPFI